MQQPPQLQVQNQTTKNEIQYNINKLNDVDIRYIFKDIPNILQIQNKITQPSKYDDYNENNKKFK